MKAIDRIMGNYGFELAERESHGPLGADASAIAGASDGDAAGGKANSGLI